MSRYHHGDLPRQLLAYAAEMAAQTGPESITLRELARRTGVTHAAPTHHFGTRRGLLTALATEGFGLINGALSRHRGQLHEMGVAYVMWALDHPGHYAVMWQPRLLDESSAELNAVRGRAWELLSGAVAACEQTADAPQAQADALAAFAVVHGLSSIWLSGALAPPADAAAMTRMITGRLAIIDRNTA